MSGGLDLLQEAPLLSPRPFDKNMNRTVEVGEKRKAEEVEEVEEVQAKRYKTTNCFWFWPRAWR